MILKTFFNKIFSEERKASLREKYASLFIAYDRRLIYRWNKKALKKILKYIIFNSEPGSWAYRDHEFLKTVKNEYIKTLFLTDTKFEWDRYEKEIQYIMKNGVDMFPYDNMHQIFYREEDVKRDTDTGLLYVMYKGNRLYFRKNYNVQDVLFVFNGLCNEQQEHSPHRYLSENIRVEEGDIVLDIGCSEGIFSLEIISKAKHVYLFEVDEGWVEALSQTFKPFKEKVTIVTKLVSDTDDDKNISIDRFMKEEHLKKIDLVKMDVEGFERKILLGAREAVDQGKIAKWLVCTYHNYGDESWVSEFLRDYELEHSEGYMLPAEWKELWNIQRPYFQRGVIRARSRAKVETNK